MTAQNWIELFGAVFGLLGNYLLAENNRRSGWGFVLFTISNVAWIWFAAANAHWFLLMQYLGFMAFSMRGIWKWLIRPPAPAAASAQSEGL